MSTYERLVFTIGIRYTFTISGELMRRQHGQPHTAVQF